MNYNKLQENIENLYQSTPETIHGVAFGRKVSNGITTDNECIIFYVPQKLFGEDLAKCGYQVPKSLVIDGKEYLTDVIEAEMAKALIVCYDYTANPLPEEIARHRRKQRPLKGGITISNFTDSYNADASTLDMGTLGAICIDKDTNSFVGLTNNHVIVKDGFVPYNQDNNGSIYNILPQKNIIQWTETGLLNLTEDSIGTVKKYYPISKGSTNYIDAALISINEKQGNTFLLNTNESWKQLGLDYNEPFSFASTSEINSLIATPRNIYHAGRTTGPKGFGGCELVITSIVASQSIIYLEQNDPVIIPFADLISFKKSDNSNYPTFSGDSGSVLIADFDGIWKIIGLVFAGSDTRGYACRIDRVAQSLNIGQWTNKLNYGYTPFAEFLITDFDYSKNKMSNSNSSLWNINYDLSTVTPPFPPFSFAGLTKQSLGELVNISSSSSSSRSSSSSSSSSSSRSSSSSSSRSSSSSSSRSSSSSSSSLIFNSNCSPCNPEFIGSWEGSSAGLCITRSAGSSSSSSSSRSSSSSSSNSSNSSSSSSCIGTCEQGYSFDPESCICVPNVIIIDPSGDDGLTLFTSPCTGRSYQISGFAFYRDLINSPCVVPGYGSLYPLCAGGHNCARTNFIPKIIFSDNTELTGTYFNLNNYPVGGNRNSTFSFDIDECRLSNVPKGPLKFKLDCENPAICHTGVSFIVLGINKDIYTGSPIPLSNDITPLYSGCLAAGSFTDFLIKCTGTDSNCCGILPPVFDGFALYLGNENAVTDDDIDVMISWGRDHSSPEGIVATYGQVVGKYIDGIGESNCQGLCGPEVSGTGFCPCKDCPSWDQGSTTSSISLSEILSKLL